MEELIAKLENCTADDAKDPALNAMVYAAARGLKVRKWSLATGDAGEDELQIDLTDGTRAQLSAINEWPLLSLDAAVTLVPEGYFWSIGHMDELSDNDEITFGASLHRYFHVADPSDALGHGLSAPLALCIAALKAKAGEE